MGNIKRSDTETLLKRPQVIAVYLTGGAREPGSAGMVLAPAAAAILAGILLIVFAEGVVNFFPTLMGILLILNGMSHLTAAGMDPENRAAATVMGVAVIIFGVLIVILMVKPTGLLGKKINVKV